MTNLTRRRAVAVLGFALGIMGVAGSRGPGLTLLSTDPRAMRIAGICRSHKSAAIIGRRYLEIYPDESNVMLLLSLLEFNDSTSGHTGLRNDSDFRLLIRRRIRRDFVEQRTVNVDGWILSQTEARIFAVTALV